MLFWKMSKKLMMIYFQYPRTNQVLEEILTCQSINMDINGMIQTIGGHQDVNEMQRNIMG